jgi:hypothetical protein
MRKTFETQGFVRLCLGSVLLAGAVGCSEPSAVKADADSALVAKTAPRAPAPVVVAQVIPSGTVLRLSLTDTLDSRDSSAGDRFAGSLAEAVVIDGLTLLPKGTLLHGRVIDAQGSGKVKGRASIRLELTDIVQGARTVNITTEAFAAEADSQQKRDTGIIAGGAGVGAVVGAIAGGKKGAAIGAIAGGGGGTGVVLATKGKEIHYGPETQLNFTLANSVKL